MSTPTFIVGTGRCGSTMLSNMLREHPSVLSLSEFYSMITDGERLVEPFSAKPMDGSQFWSLMAAITPMPSFVLRHRVPCNEFLYPCDSADARYSRETGVPAILMTTLPFLTVDHDVLFDVLGSEVANWPPAPVAEHYQHMFDWLANRFDKRLWVERSGTSLGRVEHLVSIFPDAKFVHVTRDGRDAAISMSKHPAFALYIGLSRLQQYLGVDPIESADRSNLPSVPAELLPFLPERFHHSALGAFSVPAQVCGSHWSQQIGSGLPMLASLSTDRLLTLRYEDFFADAKGQLNKLAAFLGEDYVDEEWSARCAATVRQPRSTWRDLPEAEVRALTEACRPGFEALREAGVEYEV